MGREVWTTIYRLSIPHGPHSRDNQNKKIDKLQMADELTNLLKVVNHSICRSNIVKERRKKQEVDLFKRWSTDHTTEIGFFFSFLQGIEIGEWTDRRK